MDMIPDLYPLTGLQIGDIQSYLSQAFLYFAPASHRVLILVDNRPWVLDKHSRSAKLWQLMVTKYRISPFTNNKKVRKPSILRSKSKRSSSFKPNLDTSKWSQRWFPIIDSAKWQQKYFLSVMDLSKALHGFIIFEVAWKNVHGINYLNELQMDASLALEVKHMRKWEFYSPEQALSTLALWFSGKPSETKILKKNLLLLFDPNSQQLDAHCASVEMLLRRTSSPDDLSNDDFLDVLESPSALKNEMNHLKIGFEHEMLAQETEEESPTSPTHYTDRLILFRFSDCMLPVKLRQVIMSDLRLLTLLEAGLPSWVIFFQSYPLFCQFYRPWMRHLARTLYILISLVTVIIGFYDLYKNVPLLKATASRLCGPLFGWIEEWDMISRIRYLGTMLFLQNFEKGLKCFFKLVQMARAVISVVTRPLIGPISDVFEFFSPFWTAFAECIEIIYSTMWFVLQFVHNTFLDLIESLLQPFEFLFSYICYIAKLVQSFVCFVKDLLLFPTKCIISLASYVRSLLSGISFKEMLESAKLLIKFTSVSKPKRNSYDLSVWKALWNDLFSHIFRAIRSITNGLLAFLTTCNRHRLRIFWLIVWFLLPAFVKVLAFWLSTYNHMRAIVRRFSSFVGMAPPPRCRCLRSAVSELNEEGDNTECFRCK